MTIVVFVQVVMRYVFKLALVERGVGSLHIFMVLLGWRQLRRARK